MKETLDQKIVDSLSPSVVDREPTADLVRRLRVKARETAHRPFWQRARFSVPVLTGSALVATVVVGTMVPAKASAKSFGLIVAAAQGINAFQFSIRTEEKGNHETFSIAGSNGRTVMRTDDRTIMEIDSKSMTMYDPGERKAVRFKFGDLGEAADLVNEMKSGLGEGLKEIDLKKILRDYADKYGQNGIRISPVTSEDNHRVYHVTLATADEPERVEMTVDASTDLPERLQVQTREEARGWHDAMIMEMRYGDRVDARLLQSTIPLGVKVEEIDLGSIVGEALKGLKNLSSEPKHEKP